MAVSNAYFAMFYTAQAFLEGKGLSFSKHAAVIAAFGREFAKTGELPAELHRFLIDASEDRAEADYVATSEITEDEVDVRIQPSQAVSGHCPRTAGHAVRHTCPPSA